MKMRFLTIRKRILGLCSLFAILLLTSADTLVPSPTQSQLLGSWIGYDEDRLKFYRIELADKGLGYCSVVYLEESVQVYRISSWLLEGSSVSVTLAGTSADLEPIEIKGVAKRKELILEVSATKRKWKRQLRLFKEDDFIAKYEQTKSSLDKYKREQRR